MRAMKKWFLLVIALFTIVTLVGCSSSTKSQGPVTTNIPEGELDPAVWGKEFPLVYESYKKTAEGGMTKYGGSDKVSKFEHEPEIVELFKGYGFSKEYNEDRGHVYTIEDVTSIARVNDKTTGSCMTCKAAEVPKLIEEMGDAYYTTPFSEIKEMVNHPVSCSDCHDEKTMELKITRQTFIDAMDRRGIDVTKATKEEMRAYVCGQCHVEYYFEPETKKVTFPWDNGLGPDEQYQYYQEKLPGWSDWTHPDSGAGMLKVQHPEFETWSTGTHGAAGVTCADCHMPYMRDDKGQKYSSHWWTSPLKTIEASCTTCHQEDKEWLEERVLYTQDRTMELQAKAAKVLVEAHAEIKKATETEGVNKEKLEEAKKLVVEGQWRWDWIAAENGRGFHNPAQGLHNLGKAIELGYKAKEKAQEAVGK